MDENEATIDNPDLPEDRSSSVLLLGVTRIPTSPVPVRRPCSLPLDTIAVDQRKSTAQARRNSFTRRQVVRTNSSSRSARRHHQPQQHGRWVTEEESSIDDNHPQQAKIGNGVVPGAAVVSTVSTGTTTAIMDRSVDSIGTCSLDVEASAELSDWSEASSGGTLRSASLKTPSTEPHLPSYLSLACTVNGYSTTTNYDPERLARSRDVSPHRPHQSDHNIITPRNQTPTYTIQNNLLSPPNLVPLPTLTIKPIQSTTSNMTESSGVARSATKQQQQEFYRSTKTITFISSKESHQSFTSMFHSSSKDTVDACYENGHSKTTNLYHHHQNSAYTNGQTDNCNNSGTTTTTTATTIKDFTNGTEMKTKSIVQQRIERLYGPGALAQTFFAMKKQSNTHSPHSNTIISNSSSSSSGGDNKLNCSSNDDNKENISNGDNSGMKQSTSNPTLPVLRHLRAEFRAQLPISNTSRKSLDGGPTMQKSSTVPVLKDEAKLNGHEKQLQATVSDGVGIAQSVITEESGEKDGHHFLKILQGETDRLLRQADCIEVELTEHPNLSEDVVGKIMSATGKARLLVSQKMQQFKGLCRNNITQVEGEAFPTTNEDLQGFWDMVMLQVDQVDALFKEIAQLKANNWREIPVESKKPINNKAKKTTIKPKVQSSASIEQRKQREAERKQLIEARRKAMKAAAAKQKENIEIFVPESS